MKRKKNTLHDVARAAGVSTATVSRVVNRTARVSPAVEKRIRAAAEKLSVSLQRHSDSRLIAFILSNRSLLHPFHSQVLVATEAYCAEHGYSVVFFPLNYPSNVAHEQLSIPHILRRRDILDGLVVSGVNTRNFLELLTDIGLPFSVFGDNVQGEWERSIYDVVWTDDVVGAYEITRFLHSLGHEHVWFVANTKLAWFARRHEGYCRAMESLGLKPLVSSFDSNSEREIGLLATKHILRRKEPVQAIFCGTDAICHGVYLALREAGIRVPEDISVAGFSDTPEATMLHPPVTSVRIFPEHVGRLLAELVINRIASPGMPPQERTIPTQVVKRESCIPSSAHDPGRQQLSAMGRRSEDVSGSSLPMELFDGSRTENR